MEREGDKEKGSKEEGMRGWERGLMKGGGREGGGRKEEKRKAGRGKGRKERWMEEGRKEGRKEGVGNCMTSLVQYTFSDTSKITALPVKLNTVLYGLVLVCAENIESHCHYWRRTAVAKEKSAIYSPRHTAKQHGVSMQIRIYLLNAKNDTVLVNRFDLQTMNSVIQQAGRHPHNVRCFLSRTECN